MGLLTSFHRCSNLPIPKEDTRIHPSSADILEHAAVFFSAVTLLTCLSKEAVEARAGSLPLFKAPLSSADAQPVDFAE